MSHPVPLQEYSLRMELTRQLNVLFNCLGPDVECEDIIFLTPHLTHPSNNTVPYAHAQQTSALQSQGLKAPC